MGRQIIKQPNGKYCVFSTVVDNVTDYDMTPEEIIEDWSKSFGDVSEKVNKIIDKLERGEKPYYQFTQTFDEMITFIGEVHGIEESEEVRDLCQLDLDTWIIVEDGDMFEGTREQFMDCFFSNAYNHQIKEWCESQGFKLKIGEKVIL